MVKRLFHRRSVLMTSALAVVLGVAGLGLPGRPTKPVIVTSDSGAFTIDGSVTGLAVGNEATQLKLTVSNPNTTDLHVFSVSVALDPDASPTAKACSGYLEPSLPAQYTTWDGWPTTVPGATASETGDLTPGTASISLPLKLSDDPTTNQNDCKNLSFGLHFSAEAYYTDPTTTGIVASPSTVADWGQPVTITVTVSSTYSGHAPTGSVTLAGAAGLPGGPLPLGQVECPSGSPAGAVCGGVTTKTTGLPPGSNHITATYSPTGGNPAGGQSGPDFFASNGSTDETINAGCVTTPTGAADDEITGSLRGNYEVRSGQSVWLNGGTIKGNVTVDAGGQFAATNGVITGNLRVNGLATTQGTQINGNVQSTAAGLSLGAGTSVTGNVQPSGGGPVCLNMVTVGGNVQIQKMTSTSVANICGSTIAKNTTADSSSEPVQIGGSGACAGNNIGGNLTAQANTGSVTVGAAEFGNTAQGNIMVQNNTGGGSLTGNSAGGNCTLQNNTPGITGSGNQASKQNTCNRTA